MSLRTVTLALTVVVILAALSPARAAYHGSAAAADHAARKRAYAECDLRLSHLPKYRGGPQRYLAIEGCVQDLMRRR
jgi:hypothetical protein